jgi:TRAP-type C4-dicarboxylate transport system permease small subunit
MKWQRFAESAAALVAALLLGALFVVILAGVVARYGFAHPLAWVDEIAVILFVWLVFWTGAMVVREREHVAFDLIYELLPPPWQRALGIAGALACALLLAFAVPKVADYIAFLWRERTPVLQWRQDWIYACFILFIAVAALRFAARVIELARRPAPNRRP